MEKYQKIDKSKFDKFSYPKYFEGVLTCRLTSWEEFEDVVKIFNGFSDYIWRGQRNDYPLTSSFYRSNGSRSSLTKTYEKLRWYLIDTGIKGVEKMKQKQIWAIGQHYGLETPLLDWTKDPCIAAFFAFYKKHDGDVFVYAVNKVIKRLILKRKDKNKKIIGSERIVGDISNDYDSTMNERLKRQKSEFTATLEEKNIDWVVNKLWKKKQKAYADKVILAKFIIPNHCRNQFVYKLREKKITHGVLFPDFSGAVEATINYLT